MSQSRGPKRPAGDPVKWQLQIEGGRTLGPLSTEDLLMRISQGILHGDEKIRKLPDGQWTLVSREGVFYDRLLEVLNDDNERTIIKEPGDVKPVQRQKPLEPEIYQPKKETKTDENAPVGWNPENTPVIPKQTLVNKPPAPPPSQVKPSPPKTEPKSEPAKPTTMARPGPKVIQPITDPDYIPPKKFPQSDSKPVDYQPPENYSPPDQNYYSPSVYTPEYQNSPVPIPHSSGGAPPEFHIAEGNDKPKIGPGRFLLGVIIILVAYLVYSFFLDPNSATEDTTLRIRAPHPGVKTDMSQDAQNHALAEVYHLIFMDSISTYDEAQTKLIRLIEHAPLSTEPRGLLCLVQMNLWPFVKQSSKDLENLKQTKVSGTRLDPIGLAGIHCEVSYLMVMGKYRDAMGLIEHTSNRREITEESPVLYSTKAEVMASEKNYREAVAWAEAAAKLWPQWAHPMYQVAKYNFEITDYDKAAEAFEKVLYLNPKHRQALVDYGIQIFLHLKDSKRAETFFLAATKLDDPITKTQEAQLYYYLARISMERKQNDQALAYVTKSFQLNPGDLKARDLLIQLGGSPTNVARQNQHNELVFLGDQYYRQGEYLAAQSEYKAAYEIDQSNSLAAMKAAQALWQLYQSDEALKWLGKSIAADPKLPIPYFLMADYYSQRYNFVGAYDILARGSSKLPNNSDILRGYGLVYLRSNNHKQAIQYLERALKATEDVDTLTLLASAYLTAREGSDPQKAMTYATKAIQLEDANPEAQIVYAKVLAVLRGVPAAVSYMKERIKKYSYTREYTLGLAEIYQEAEMFKQAQDEYEKVRLDDPKNKKALMGLGECYQHRAMLNDALKMYLAGALQDPSDPEPVFKAGTVLMDSGKFKEAMTEFKSGIAINKVYPRGYYLFGKAALAVKDFPLVLDAAKQEKLNNPNMADAYILAGEAYKEMRDYKKCAAEYQMAVKIRPKGAENYVKLAQCQVWDGNFEVAENMLAIAKEQESGYADIYKLQGSIFERRGEVREACLAYQNFENLAPNSPDRKEIDEKISNLCGGK